MRTVVALAAKDLRLLVRLRSGLFFTFVWPLLIAVGFGLILGGAPEGSPVLSVSVADEDGTSGSLAFVERLERGGELDVHRTSLDEAIDMVRRGQRTAAIVIAAGFGASADRVFFGAPPRVRLVVDPSRRAETGILEGVLMTHGMAIVERVMSDTAEGRGTVARAMRALPPEPERTGHLAATGRFLGELQRFLADGQPAAGGGAAWRPLEVVREDVRARAHGPASPFDYTFPQGVLWGLLGCVMAFAVGLVVERTHGTLVRLQAAPVTRAQVLGGKALACLLATLALQAVMFTIGASVFGVRIASVPHLVAAALSASVAFVGLMMLVAAVGRNEQATSAAGWAMLMPLAMVGGGMIPLFVMPGWLLQASHLSPVKWAILAYEGATWRAFAPFEMLVPCLVLVTVGVVAFGIGTRLVRTV
jgi:ABC-2 type transport system permease protein